MIPRCSRYVPLHAPATKPRKPRGFASMDPKLVSELAKRGGKAAHRAGTAHQFTSAEAREAGRRGGLATHAKGPRMGKLINFWIDGIARS